MSGGALNSAQSSPIAGIKMPPRLIGCHLSEAVSFCVSYVQAMLITHKDQPSMDPVMQTVTAIHL